jgi:nucleoporin SEH1
MLTSFPLAHDDYVHDIAFDFYGKRIATASSDQKIKIWEKKQGNEG